MFYVYYLLDPETLELLYIGRSGKPALRKIAFEKRTGLKVIFGAPQRFSSFDRSCVAELKAILRHQPPYNVKLISSNGRQGHHCSPEYREKLSLALKGRVGTMTGKHHSPETRAKISNSNKGRAGTMLGVKFTAEHKAKISAGNKGKTGWAKGTVQKPEHTEKIRQAKIKRDQEKRARCASPA